MKTRNKGTKQSVTGLCIISVISFYMWFTLRKIYPKVVSKENMVGSGVKLYTAMVE